MFSAKPFSIKVVGAFDVVDRHGHSVRPSGRKDCALLAMLALSRNHRQTRTWLQEKLWGDRGPAQGAASLRQSLTTLRSILNCDEIVIDADRTWVWLESGKLEFDHLTSKSSGEFLRGFDLREDGFNDWLSETRSEFAAQADRWGTVDKRFQTDRRWFLDVPTFNANDVELAGISELICDSLVESLSVIGIHSVIDKRINPKSLPQRATDIVVRSRAFRMDSGCILSLCVTDGFGSVKWQIRRETDLSKWSELRLVQIELAQLFQDFAIRSEANCLRGARWSAYANGCQALMGILVPGSMPLQEIARCSEAAIAADEKGIYHALLGFSHLLIYGERESLALRDADEVMQSFRTAMQQSPENGLVQALAGHSYGFFLRDFDRNAELTKEAVRLLPGNGLCWIYHAISLIYCSRYEDAAKASNHAILLCKGTIVQAKAYACDQFTRLMAGDVKGAVRSGEVSLDSIVFRPTIMDLMTGYALSGEIEKGRKKLQLLIDRDPDLSVDMLKSQKYPIVNPTHRSITIQAAGSLGLH